jgi:hypothetical protein
MAALFGSFLIVTRHSKPTSPHPPWLLTTNAAPKTPSAFITPSLHATLLLHATREPLHCTISQHGAILLTESNTISPGEYRAAVNLTKGEDLLIVAEWKDESPHTLRAEVLVHGYQATLEKTFWAQQSLEDTLPVPDSFLPSP